MPDVFAKGEAARGVSTFHPCRRSPGAVVLAVALSGCSGHADADAPEPKSTIVTAESASPMAHTDKIEGGRAGLEGYATLTGVRISEGNAVECAQIRTDDGMVHPVSGLTGAVAVGDRIAVSGTFGVSTSCVGRVLMIREIKRL